MLSIFPEMLFLSPFAALLLRVSVAILIASGAWSRVSRPSIAFRVIALIEFGVALGLVAGAWTQVFAIISALWLGVALFWEDARIHPKSTLVLAIAISLSLVVTGPGALAFDLPL